MDETGSWRDYIQITKPRIIVTNLYAALGGFWVASQWDINLLLLIQMLIGSALVMACSCVLNNYLDRELDQKMARTNRRPLVIGTLKPTIVLWYGITLGLAGLAVLYNINLLSLILGLIGIFVYVVVYTMWLKRTSTWSTSIGGISGAMPPVIGYCAVSNELDAGAWTLFLILFLWQPPHFWALGIRRKEEYRAAGFPLLPVVKGVKRTKLQMIPYVILLIPTTTLLFYYGYVGVVFLITGIVLGLIWLVYCIAGLRTKDDDTWSKKTFMFSIYYLMIIFLVMMLDTTPTFYGGS